MPGRSRRLKWRRDRGLLRRRSVPAIDRDIERIDESWDPAICDQLAHPFGAGMGRQARQSDDVPSQLGLALSRWFHLWPTWPVSSTKKGIDLVLSAADEIIDAADSHSDRQRRARSNKP